MIADAGVNPQDALSLVGRALFFRFLVDRRIISDRHMRSIRPNLPGVRPADAMKEPAYIEATSRWLHKRFNGNLMLLQGAHQPKDESAAFWAGFWERLNNRSATICGELSKILHKTDEKGQYSFRWDTLDFGHIPVGLLSQVYEAWYHAYAPAQAQKDSVRYTPRSIAEYVTAEAFFGLPKAHAARVLDPAVGAGVFLVTAYREIVAARWRHDKKRPDRKALREILYQQLVGFDINEAALRLTALSLYLTALELDPDPRPPHRLRFRDLRKIGVLCDVREGGDEARQRDGLPMLGSLGSHISADKHTGQYDIVLGNPPWTAWTSEQQSRDPVLLALCHHVENNVILPIVRKRLEDDHATFAMIDRNPDLAFLARGRVGKRGRCHRSCGARSIAVQDNGSDNSSA